MNRQQHFSNDEIDKMKADAIRRARQMQSRATMPNVNQLKNEQNFDQNCRQNQKPSDNLGEFPFIKNLYSMIGSLGLSHDQIILIALILMLSQEKDNIMLVVALLYIAM